MKKIVILIFAFLSLNSLAASPFWIGGGTLTHNFLSSQNKAAGDTKIVEFAPAFLIGATFPLFGSDFFLAPAIGFAKFFPKDNTTKTELIIQYHLSRSFSSFFQLRYGFSNYITKISGDGGDLVLNNGTTSATFYTPKDSKTSYTASADIAGDFIFSPNWSLRAQLSMLRFLSGTSRKVSHLLSLNYYF